LGDSKISTAIRVLDGDGKNLIRPLMITMAIKKIQLPQKAHLWLLFKKLSKGFQKHVK
jgi:hypothetical protein